MGFNSVFKGLIKKSKEVILRRSRYKHGLL